MQRCTYQVAKHIDYDPETREGYLFPITASCGTVVNLMLVKMYGEWFGDHAPTGYAIGGLRAPTRKKLIELIESKQKQIANKAVEKARNVPVLNPDLA